MPAEFFPEDPAVLDERLIAAFDAAPDGLLSDHRVPGTPGYNLRALWRKLLRLHNAELNTVFATMSPRTATGASLDAWAQFFGTTRRGQQSASGTVVLISDLTGAAIERLAGTRTITAGSRLIAPGVVLVTTDDVTFSESARTATVSVDAYSGSTTAARAGQTLTLESGALQSMVRGETLTDIAGGRAAETDAQLRYRLVNALTNPSTTDGFLIRLLAETGVSTASVLENVYGPATLEAFVVPSTSLPSPTLRATLEGLWVGAGRAYVVFPDYEAVVLKIRATGTYDPSTVVDYVNNLGVGQPIVLNAIETLLQNAGATDAQVIGIKRGVAFEDGTYTGLETLTQITNLTPTTARSKWYTQSSWLTFCS